MKIETYTVKPNKMETVNQLDQQKYICSTLLHFLMFKYFMETPLCFFLGVGYFVIIIAIIFPF